MRNVRFVGLDVHAATIAIAVAESSGEVRSLGTIANRPDAVRRLVRKLGRADEVRVCYEAGPTGYGLCWQLLGLGVHCDVVVHRVEELWVVAPELLPHAVGQTHAFSRQVLVQARPLPQLDDRRVGRLQPPETMRVGTQRRGQHASVPPVVLRPGRRQAVSKAVELFRVDRVTAKPHSIRLSTTGPRGVSTATPTSLALPFANDSSQSAICSSPSPPCSNTREPSQLQVEPPVCRIERARPDACRSLYWRSTAQTPHWASIGGWTAGAQVLLRCSKHWGPLGAPGGLPDPARPSRGAMEKGTGVSGKPGTVQSPIDQVPR